MSAESFNTKTDSNVEEVKKCEETMFWIKTMAHEKKPYLNDIDPLLNEREKDEVVLNGFVRPFFDDTLG